MPEFCSTFVIMLHLTRNLLETANYFVNQPNPLSVEKETLMRRNIFSAVTFFVALLILTPVCIAQTQNPPPSNEILKQRKRNTLSVALEFTKKKRNPLERTLSLVFNGITPNGYATGFLVDNGLVMTAYHVVSGELSPSKKKLLGFKPNDDLEVNAYINNCHAKVVRFDRQADLALLKMCEPKHTNQTIFQMDPDKDEKLLIIAQPGNDKIVRQGSLHGFYTFRGLQYLSIKTDGQDGFSGSPVYNYKGEIIGLFCLYDWTNSLAIISPGEKVKKLLEDYRAETPTQVTQ